MNSKQFDQVIALPGPERYAHFISRVADWQEVWTLKQPDGYVTFGDDEGNYCVPLWPHHDYAMTLATGDWSNCSAESLDLDSLLDKWIPVMIRDGYKIAVFPTPKQKSVVVSPERLNDDLKTELEKME
jgi:hypothetical protein